MKGADLILHNANVLTLDPQNRRANLVALRRGRIVGVGGGEELETFRGPQTKLIDCKGRTVVPGFIDAHAHIMALASSLVAVDCGPSSVSSIAEIQERIREEAGRVSPGLWLRAWGYHEFYLAERRHPTRHDLDAATPHHPVRLLHRSRHACALNTLGLKLARISGETPDPPGGLIERDLQTGEPTGLLFGMNAYLTEKVLPPLSPDELERGMKRANQALLAFGITSVQDATITNGPQEWQTFARLKQQGKLIPRICMMLGLDAIPGFQGLGVGPGGGDDGLRLGPVKLSVDETRGPLHPSQDQLNEQVLRAQWAGFPAAIHALDEGPLAAAIAALEHAFRCQPGSGLLHRIEHCSLCPPPLLQRLQALKVAVVSHPAFIYFSGERYRAEVPPSQQPGLYRVGSFLRAGLTVAAGSDCPVVPPDPIAGIYAAVTRRAQSGDQLNAEEAITPHQALALYTRGGASASGEGRLKGTIEVGKLADLVVLSRDPTKVPTEGIKGLRVEMTVVGGSVVWGKG